VDTKLTFKEWNAVILLTGQVLVTAWLLQGTQGFDGNVSEISGRLIWAIGLMVAFNILGTIVVTVLVSLVRREALKDEAMDERDRSVSAKSMRNAYFVLSVGAASTLVLLAVGITPALGVYLLFGALMLAGATDSVSKLLYYRFG
jgi:formate/nitrite transporter FocA (FNT family)